LTKQLPYYSVVRVLRTTRTSDLRIDNLTGVIAGISDSGSHIEYAVLIGDTTWMVDSRDVVPTGEVLNRETSQGV
jgi:membrane protein implicated in regulation of membrane protease activity